MTGTQVENGTRRRGRPRAPDVETKVRAATRSLIDEAGYDGTTIEAIATRAGVTKAAIYRRWANKATLVYDAVLVRDPEQNAVPDTNDLRADLLAVLRQNSQPMRHRMTNALINRLIAEAANDQALAEELRSHHFEPRARQIAQRVHLAVERGELADTIDAELVPALLTGPLQYLLLVHGSDLAEPDLQRIVSAVITPHLPHEPRRREPKRDS